MWIPENEFRFECLYCGCEFNETETRIERGWLSCPICKEKKQLRQINPEGKIDYYKKGKIK